MVHVRYSRVCALFIALVCALFFAGVNVFLAYRAVFVHYVQLRQFHQWYMTHHSCNNLHAGHKLLPSIQVPIKKFHTHMLDPLWLAQTEFGEKLYSAERPLHYPVRRKRKTLLTRYSTRTKRRTARRQASVSLDEHMYNSAALLQWPIERSNFWLSSRYGPRRKEDGSWGFHYAIDLAAPKGTPVAAANDGVVIEAGYSARGYGKTVVLYHQTIGYQTRYAHLNEIVVKNGQQISCGDCIGYVGDTGYVRGENGGRNASHLHFEVKRKGKHVDPLTVLV